MKKSAVLIVLILLLGEKTIFAQSVCQELFQEREKNETFEIPKFQNGHNQALRQVMQKFTEYENDLNEFVQKIKNPELRSQEALDIAIQKVTKYRSLFEYVIKHAQSRMMTPRIERVEELKQTDYAKQYQGFYIEYSKYIDLLLAELYRLQELPSEKWNPQEINNILSEMHNAQPYYHQKS